MRLHSSDVYALQSSARGPYPSQRTLAGNLIALINSDSKETPFVRAVDKWGYTVPV